MSLLPDRRGRSGLETRDHGRAFEIEPAPGVKVNRIVTLADDLAMALRAVGVRILAPVPGTAVVGIEVANTRREHIALKEIIESEPFGAGTRRVRRYACVSAPPD